LSQSSSKGSPLPRSSWGRDSSGFLQELLEKGFLTETARKGDSPELVQLRAVQCHPPWLVQPVKVTGLLKVELFLQFSRKSFKNLRWLIETNDFPSVFKKNTKKT